MDLDTRCRLSAKIIPWARDLENFISLFIIKLLNLNLTQSFSCRSRAGASCSAYWALLITGIRIHPALQLPSMGHPIQLFLPFIVWGDDRSWRSCQSLLSHAGEERVQERWPGSLSPQYHCTVNARCNYRERPKKQSTLSASSCIILVTPQGGNPEPALFTPSLLLSHTLPPTAGLITGIKEGAVCSVLSSQTIIFPLTERQTPLFCCQSSLRIKNSPPK